MILHFVYSFSIFFRNPVMTGQIFFGGSVQDGGPVTVTKDKELSVDEMTLLQEMIYTDV